MPQNLPQSSPSGAAPLHVAVLGRGGRMASGSTGVELATALAALPTATVVCDFTHPEAHARLLQGLARVPLPLVTGTSGLSDADEARLRQQSAHGAIIRGRNFSLGAVMARMLIEKLAELSCHDPVWQAAVLDFHHARKLDPESATARDWAAAWQDRDPSRTAPVSAIRLGNGISEHSLIAAGKGERVEIAHRLLSLDAPLSGILAGIRFVAGRTHGFFEPSALLDLR